MDDLEFVQSCVKGDKQSWDTFVAKYSRLIYNYIHSVLKLKGTQQLTQDDIHDLFQGIFLSLVKDDFKKLRSFQGKNGCSLASWLRQIAIHATVDHIRRIKPTVSLEQENDDEFSLQDVIADPSLSAKDSLSHKEKLSTLADCIAGLNTDDRYFLELHINNNLNLEELKDILLISRPATDMRKLRIIERLRDCFKSKGFKLDF